MVIDISKIITGILLSLIVLFGLFRSINETNQMNFGQKRPGLVPERFAPGIVNSEAQNHSCVSISPEGKEMYWSAFSTINDIRQERIWFANMINGSWTPAEVASFSGEYRDSGPRFSYDGKRLYFTSIRPTDKNDAHTDANTWYIEKIETGWGHPQLLGYPANSEFHEWGPTITKNGNLYFMYRRSCTEFWNIYFSEYKNGKYNIPIKLGDAINSDFADGFPFIHPDEKYLIFYSERPGGSCDEAEMFISFRNRDGSWSKAKDMGPLINSSPTRFAGLSPDGKYFFFSRKSDSKEEIYWVNAKIIDTLKPDTVN